MRVLVTGAAGQLGCAMMEELEKRGHEAIGAVRSVAGAPVRDQFCIRLDITDRQAVMAAVTEHKPGAIVHCAAWTAVDLAENEENVNFRNKANTSEQTGQGCCSLYNLSFLQLYLYHESCFPIQSHLIYWYSSY